MTEMQYQQRSHAFQNMFVQVLPIYEIYICKVCSVYMKDPIETGYFVIYKWTFTCVIASSVITCFDRLVYTIVADRFHVLQEWDDSVTAPHDYCGQNDCD